jgi:transposase InsO family protein
LNGTRFRERSSGGANHGRARDVTREEVHCGEFTATRVREWLGRVKTLNIAPVSPWENGYLESFNGKLRDELLAREVFDTLLEAKVLIERWRKASNTVRPHSSLGYRPPVPESRRPCPLASATPQQADRGDPLAGLPW